jgi:hypothetical protein
VTPTDAGIPYNTAFGQYPGYFGGTYFFPYGPPTIAGPGQPGTDVVLDPDSGNYCSVPWSQNSFVATVTPASKSWILSGTVAGFSGAGLYIQSAPNLCVDASAYTGVSFTISGTIGSSAEAGADADADAGTAQTISLKAFEAADTAVSTASGAVGTCALGAACTPPTFPITLSTTPTPMTVRWVDFTGGNPDLSVGDPAHLSGIEWDLPWPCTGGVPYPVHITIQDVQFITN